VRRPRSENPQRVQHVYKLKKPVRRPFLDFRAIEARERRRVCVQPRFADQLELPQYEGSCARSGQVGRCGWVGVPARVLSPICAANVEHPSARSATSFTFALGGQMPSRDLMPVAANQQRMALVTVGSLAWIMDVPGKGIAHTVLHRDAAGARQSFFWRRRNVSHSPIQMESREVPRYVGTKTLYHP
jgi:hypothetical protein